MGLLTACGAPHEPPETHTQGPPHRIISLSPAATDLLRELSLDDRIIGASAFCRDADHLPVVGDLSGVDAEALIRLRPDLLVYQETAAPPPAGLFGAADMVGAETLAVPVDDMADLHRAIDTLAHAADPERVNPQIARRCAQLHATLDEALLPGVGLDVSVLLLQPGPNILAWGGRTWLGHVVTAAGARPLLEDRSWTGVSSEDVIRLEPDMIFVLSEHADVDTSAITTLDTPASKDGQVHVLAHPRLMIPGVHALELRRSIDALLSSAANTARFEPVRLSP